MLSDVSLDETQLHTQLCDGVFFFLEAFKSDSQQHMHNLLIDSLHNEAPHPTCIFLFQKIIELKVKTCESPKRCKGSDREHNTALHIRGS